MSAGALILVSTFSLVRASSISSNINTYELTPKISLTPIKDEGRFFLCLKSNLILDIDPFKMTEMEKLLGSFKKKIQTPLRTISTDKLRAFGIIADKHITFLDAQKGKVLSFEVKQNSVIQLIENPFDSDSYYARASLMLTPFTDETDLNSEDVGKFDSVAVLGTSHRLKNSKFNDFAWEEYQPITSEFDEFDKDFISRNSLPAGYSNFSKSIFKNDSMIFYKISNNSNNDSTVYVITKDKFKWGVSEKGIHSKKSRILAFGDNIEGAQFSLLVEHHRKHYLNVFYQDKVEMFYLGNF